MQYRLNKASEIFSETPFEIEVEIETLQDLQDLQEQYGYGLIVDFDEKQITIYDYA